MSSEEAYRQALKDIKEELKKEHRCYISISIKQLSIYMQPQEGE